MPISSPVQLNMGPPEFPVLDDRRGLEELGQREVARDGLPARADDARAERVAEAVRRANDEDRVADANGVGIPERRDHRVAGYNRGLDDRDVGPGLGSDHARGHGILAEELDDDFVHRVDDVRGGGDLAIRRDQHALGEVYRRVNPSVVVIRARGEELTEEGLSRFREKRAFTSGLAVAKDPNHRS